VDTRDLLDKLATRSELSHYILCTDEDKYSMMPSGLRVVEGSDYLVLRIKYCENLYKILKALKHFTLKGFSKNTIRV